MMLARLRSFTKLLPLILISIVVALAVWTLAVTSSDPSETLEYPHAVPIEIIGQSTNLVLTNDLPDSVTIDLRAPTSIWRTLNEETSYVRAFIDLSSVAAGETTVPVQVQVAINPVEIVSFTPQQVDVVMETLSSKQFDIVVVTRGALPVGYQSDEPQLSESSVMVSGAESRVAQVAEVHAVVDLTQVRSNINTTISLQPVDANGLQVSDVTVTPDEITLLQSITQRGGYRNVVVIVKTEGQVLQGYRLSSITVNPPTVTVYSTDAALVDALPGSVETNVVSLIGQQDDFTQTVELNLPENLQVLGSSEVEVQVDIEPVVSSIALSDIPIIESGLATNLIATFLPEKANIIITGPLPVLEAIFISDVRVLLDLTGYLPGTYSITEPVLSLNIPGLTIESISPNAFEVTIVPGN